MTTTARTYAWKTFTTDKRPDGAYSARSQQNGQTWACGVPAPPIVGLIVACQNGYHASPTLYDALGYVDDGVIGQVEMHGDLVEHARNGRVDKYAAREMTLLRAWVLSRERLVAVRNALQERLVSGLCYGDGADPFNSDNLCSCCDSVHNIVHDILDVDSADLPVALASAIFRSLPGSCEHAYEDDTYVIEALNEALVTHVNAAIAAQALDAPLLSWQGRHGRRLTVQPISLAQLREELHAMLNAYNRIVAQVNERRDYEEGHEDLLREEDIARAFDRIVLPFLDAESAVTISADPL